jgi:predicted enzyme related to lactoylglutathione lyase
MAQERSEMPIKAKYVHTNLTGRDWRVLSQFYCEVFGCIPKPPQRDLSGKWLDDLTSLSAAHLTGIHLALPGCGEGGPTLEIFSYDHLIPGGAPVVNEPGFGHIAFLVDDVDAALQAVRIAGGGAIGNLTKHSVPGVGLLTVVYATDPDGNIIELQNWT